MAIQALPFLNSSRSLAKNPFRLLDTIFRKMYTAIMKKLENLKVYIRIAEQYVVIEGVQILE